MTTRLSKIFGGAKKAPTTKATTSGVSALVSPTPPVTAWWGQHKMITPSAFNINKVGVDPKFRAQAGTGAVAPMPSIPLIPSIPKAGSEAALQWAAALFVDKPNIVEGGVSTKSKKPLKPTTSPIVSPIASPTLSPIQQQARWLLSGAGYKSSYKPKKDFLANLWKEEIERYLRMYGPFKSIE